MAMSYSYDIQARGYTERMANTNFEPDGREALRVQKAVEGKTVIGVAQWVATTGDPMERRIACEVLNRLKELEGAGVATSFKVAHVGDLVPRTLVGARGVTSCHFGKASSHVEVWVNGADVTGKVGTSVPIVLHELVHAATMGAVRLGNLKPAMGSKLAADVSDLYAVSDFIMTKFGKRFADTNETLAWALTDPEAQFYLESIPYQSKLAWTAFIEAIRKFLSLPSSANAALSEVLRAAEAIMSDNINEMVSMASITGTAMAIQSASDQMITSSLGD